MTEIVEKVPDEKELKLEAMRGKIVVERLVEEKIGMLYLPQSAASRSVLGRVVSVYDSFRDPHTAEDVEPFIQIGDAVIFGQNAGVEIDMRVGTLRKKFMVLREAEVLCKVSNLPEMEGKE